MLKKAVSLILFFSIFFLLFTSLVVFVEPPARVAAWADWSFLGLSREHWDAAHLGMVPARSSPSRVSTWMQR